MENYLRRLVVPLLLLTSVCTMAQPGKATLSGTIKDSAQNWLPYVTVELLRRTVSPAP